MKSILLLILTFSLTACLLAACSDDSAGTDNNNNRPRCGNAVIEGDEQCDGQDLGGETCEDLGFYAGTLSCGDDCRFDTTGCDMNPCSCGDGIQGCTEQCDGEDLRSETCEGLGYVGGTLACTSDCTFDTAGCHHCGNGTVDATEECDDGNQTAWDGCTECAITEFQVNTNAQDSQVLPDVSTGPDGNFVVVWNSWLQNPTDYAVFGQVFDASGMKVGPEFEVSTTTELVGTYPSVSMAADGSFVVVRSSWSFDGSLGGVVGRRFDPSGSPLGPEFQVNTYTDQSQDQPSVAMAPDGSFCVVWTSEWQDDGISTGIYGQRFDASGATAEAEFRINTHTEQNQGMPDISMAPDASFVVVWGSEWQDGDGVGVFGKRYLANGTADGSEFQVNTTTEGLQNMPSVSVAGDGSFVVVWQNYPQIGGPSDVFGQMYDSTGNAVGTEFQINTPATDYQRDPRVSAAADGSFVVVWHSEEDDGKVFGRLYDITGNPLGSQFQVNIYSYLSLGGPSVSSASDGRFVVVWSSGFQDGDAGGIFGQRYLANGQPRGVLSW